MLKRVPWRSLVVAKAAVLLTAAFASPLEYSRRAVLAGQAWRLLTCHFIHGTFNHLLWDVLPLVGVGLLFERYLRGRFWIAFAVSSLTVGGGLFLLQPDLPSYCGLSGVLNGLWVAGALSAARQERAAGDRALASVYLGSVFLLLGKVLFEAATGTPLFTDPQKLGGVPVPLAHALGALGGVLVLTPRSAGSETRQARCRLRRRSSFGPSGCVAAWETRTAAARTCLPAERSSQ